MTGRPAAPPRLIAGLLHLQHAYNLSDRTVAKHWMANGYPSAAAGRGLRPVQAAHRSLPSESLVGAQRRGEGVEFFCLPKPLQ